MLKQKGFLNSVTGPAQRQEPWLSCHQSKLQTGSQSMTAVRQLSLLVGDLSHPGRVAFRKGQLRAANIQHLVPVPILQMRKKRKTCKNILYIYESSSKTVTAQKRECVQHLTALKWYSSMPAWNTAGRCLLVLCLALLPENRHECSDQAADVIPGGTQTKKKRIEAFSSPNLQ